MREEVTNWFKQGEADFRSAQNSKKSFDFHMSVFASQQAVEKALKALCLHRLREFPKGHSIIHLARKVDAPEHMLSGIRDLNPEYLSTRYPDMAAGIPAELYDENIAARHLKTAEQVIEWVRQQIQE
ncbi:MAG TPA: HEPN domain-containing protein [Sedimentisphaerales bacterium]|nr:HEPN domain-containing protein [Sedimentisphaerales bacterium]